MVAATELSYTKIPGVALTFQGSFSHLTTLQLGRESLQFVTSLAFSFWYGCSLALNIMKGQQRMTWLHTTDPMGMNLSKPREIVKDRGAWPAAVHGVAESDMTEQLN